MANGTNSPSRNSWNDMKVIRSVKQKSTVRICVRTKKTSLHHCLHPKTKQMQNPITLCWRRERAPVRCAIFKSFSVVSLTCWNDSVGHKLLKSSTASCCPLETPTAPLALSSTPMEDLSLVVWGPCWTDPFCLHKAYSLKTSQLGRCSHVVR